MNLLQTVVKPQRLPLLLFACIFCFSQTTLAQNKHTISGKVENASSGEVLIGASVYVPGTAFGTTTNVYGFYSITLPADSVKLLFSYIGFKKKEVSFLLRSDTSIDITLAENTALDEVVITADASENIQNRTQMSTVRIDMDKVNSLPALMGERDLIKTIQLLPGVQSGAEGASGLYVRGGGPDQNLILLDGVPVYNASHLFGFFSVFNADAINSVELIKGGFPARYGGRLSSVLDIRMKEGNMKEFKASGSVGIISSKLSIEGPIWKERTSFVVSGRRTYVDILSRPFIRAASRQQEGSDVIAGYYFYDLNAKINHKFSNKSRLFFSSYLGDDEFYFRIKESYNNNGFENTSNADGGLQWGNRIAALRWNYQISPKLFSNTTVTYSRYRFNTENTFEETVRDINGNPENNRFYMRFFSGIDDWTAKVDFDYLPSPNHYVRFGIGDIYHQFSPGAQQMEIAAPGFENDTTSSAKRIYGHEMYAYIEDDIKISDRLKVHPGVYFTLFRVQGVNYPSFQPRINARFLISRNASIKASYAHMAQFLHLLTNPTIGLPTDLWVPATREVLPEYSHQYALGYAQTLFKQLELSIEGYYKTMNNLIEYRDGTSFQGADQDWESKIEQGRGWSYGGEVLLEKKKGKFSGWLGYTLSWTQRQFDNINFGKPFFYRYDRRHDVSLALTYKHSDRWDFGLVWVYGTGNAYTLGLERYNGLNPYPSFGWFNQEIEHIDQRNNFRAPAYHRLDIGANLHTKTKWGTGTWSFSIYNTYNRQNPFYIYWGYVDQNNGNDSRRALKQVSIFPLIPSISYAFTIE